MESPPPYYFVSSIYYVGLYMSGCVDSTVYIIFINTVVGVKRTSSGWVLGEEEEREL